jgi:hypothetical protein
MRWAGRCCSCYLLPLYGLLDETPFIHGKETSLRPLGIACRHIRKTEPPRPRVPPGVRANLQARQYGRFTRSFVKQFAQQEARNLQRRARIAAAEGAQVRPRWVTLVAVEGPSAAADEAVKGAAGAADGAALPWRPQDFAYTAAVPAADAAAEPVAVAAAGAVAGPAAGPAAGAAAGVVVGTLDLRLASEEQLEAWARLAGDRAPQVCAVAALLQLCQALRFVRAVICSLI